MPKRNSIGLAGEQASSLSSLPQISEINMTPLMDLTFILLITFIITFPLIEQGIPLNLPKEDAAELGEDRSRTISITAQGRLYLDSREVALEELRREIQAIGQADPDTVVYLRSDESVRYGEIAKLLSILHEANIAKMALVTQGAEEEDSR